VIDLVSDLRLAARRLARAPGFTAAAVATLAIGIGAVAGVGAILYGLIWRPLPAVGAPDLQVVVPSVAGERVDPDDAELSWREVEALEASDAISGVATAIGRNLTLTGSSDPQRVLGASVGPAFFDVVETRPLLGRTFAPDEGRTFGFETVAVLSHALWISRYAGDPGIVGRPIEINQRQVEVIGVLPPGFGLPGHALLYLPFAPGPEVDLDGSMAWTLVRPADGDPVKLGPRVADLFERLAAEAPAGSEPRRVRLIGLRRALGPDDSHIVVLLGGVVLAILLLCCTNVANLLIARAVGAEGELAVRAALGAGRARLVRQTLAESLLLALAGTALGALLGRVGVDFAIATLAEDRPVWMSFDYDRRLAVGGALLVLLTTLACGLWPALRASDARLLPRLGGGSGRSSERRGARRSQRALVVVQFALAIGLLAAGSWMTRSFLALTTADVGFETRNLLTLRLYLPGDRYDDPAARARFHRDLIARVEGLPGVTSAATTGAIPVDDGGAALRVANEASSLAPEETLSVTAVPSQPELFATLGIALESGTTFAADTAGDADAPAVVVNRALADALWPGEPAVGRRLRLGARAIDPFVTIAGVAPDLIYEELTEQTPRSRLQLFLPYGRMPWRTTALLVRTGGEPTTLVPAVRAAIRAIESDAPVYDVLTMPSRVAITFEDRRFVAQLVGLFAAQGLLLAAVGVFGVLSYAVARRRRELGIRAALGAGPRAIAGEVGRDGLRLAGWGALAGLGLALAGGRALRGFVYGIDPLAPAPLVGVVALLGAVAALACALPARRAARLDPSRTLREE